MSDIEATEQTAAEQTETDHDDREGLTGTDTSANWTSFRHSAYAVLKPIASLKLTVVLFAMAIFIVLAGTFAQVDKDIWAVINEYFRIDFTRVGGSQASMDERLREFFVFVDFQIFLPQAFFTEEPPDLPSWFGILFPKGWTIGAVMLANLLTAHFVRFRVQTSGARLAIGAATIGLGGLVTGLVIMSGHESAGIQSDSLFSYQHLWIAMQVCLVLIAILAGTFAFASPTQQKAIRWTLIGTAVVVALAQLATMIVGPIDDSSMRILYQLLKGLLAGGVLLAGCILVFKKRAGIVLLHGGIGLMMMYDVLVGTSHIESRMMIEEGETTHFSEDVRTAELAIVDRSGADDDVHTVLPASLLKAGDSFHDEKLPFDVEIVEWLTNSDLRRITPKMQDEPSFDNRATLGTGQRYVAVPMRVAAGTDTDGQVDMPAAYVALTNSKTGDDLGTFLVSVLMKPPFSWAPDQQVTVDDKTYDFSLRFKRLYKPYSVSLIDVQKNNYIGTDNPRDYRSKIKIVNPEQNTEFEFPVWMNNPLRYGGETFYQQSYYEKLYEGGKETTSLQVVSNTGWMLPYVSCMIVMVGMLYQFVLTLMRFLNRRLSASKPLMTDSLDNAYTAPSSQTRQERRKAAKNDEIALRKTIEGQKSCGWLSPTIAALLTAAIIAAVASPRSTPSTEMQVDAFGELPILYRGRPQPFNTLAMNTLLAISDKQSFKQDSTDKDEKSKSATTWLLDVIVKPKLADTHEVFRIESIEIQKRLGLERRDGSRYAIDEFREAFEKETPELEVANERLRNKELIDLQQRKLLDLHSKVSAYNKLQTSFSDMGPMVPALPTPEEIANDEQAAMQKALELKQFLTGMSEVIDGFRLPLAVPMHLKSSTNDEQAIVSFAELKNADWLAYPMASVYAELDRRLGQSPPPAFAGLQKTLAAYKGGKINDFNTAVANYRELLDSVTPKQLAPPDAHTDVRLTKTAFEAYYNNVGPFNFASWLYVIAGVLTIIGWLVKPTIFNRAAIAVIGVTFVLHTLAIVGRIYISGRPPVTNLYSSAIFISWAGVVFGLILEAIDSRGIGNVIAASIGFLTLRIAHGLALDGDTFAVLEAVLDTQFWLATHVVCVTLGYASTFVAAALGMLYLFNGLLVGNLDSDMDRSLTRMNYGVLCFALLFSSVGTVLGGLWADDSWGRFWGWDPKENGALIIVLWNALVLHARWDRMIKGRGLAVLTVLGGIVVSWSWFGTNELGVGLHSYGFTEGRLAKLGWFCVISLAIASLGCLPRAWWRSQPNKPV